MEANNNKAMREALESFCTITESDVQELVRLSKRLIDEDIYGGGIIQNLVSDIGKARAALAKPPRACDVMSQEDLTKVVISGFMKSLGIGPENQLVSQLAEAAISAAIKCAYDTQLVSKEVEGAK